MRPQFTLILLFCISLMSIGASGAVVTSWNGGTVQTFPVLEYQGPGPITFGPGITWSSTNASNQAGSLFGFTFNYSFLGNGFWSFFDMAGLNDSRQHYGVTDTMTFAFSTPVRSVGGFLNYVPPPDSDTPTTIAVWDSMGNLIESFNLNFLLGQYCINCGVDLGFYESTADIAYFTLTDNYIGIANLTTNFSAVPEPSSLALVSCGILALAAGVRRKFNL